MWEALPDTSLGLPGQLLQNAESVVKCVWLVDFGSRVIEEDDGSAAQQVLDNVGSPGAIASVAPHQTPLRVDQVEVDPYVLLFQSFAEPASRHFPGELAVEDPAVVGDSYRALRVGTIRGQAHGE